MFKHTNTKLKSRPELLAFSGILGFTLLSATILASSHATADNDTVTDNISIEVPVSCTMGGTGQNSHEATLLPGTYSGASGSQYQNGIGTTTLTTFCNDNNGFSIYAIGYSDDTDGNNTLIGENTSLTIPTKVYESTDTTSNWSMKVNKVENQSGQDPVAWNPENMTITNSFSSWHTVPDDYAKVAEYKATTGSSATDTTLGGKVTTTYASYISTTQAADTYEGQVKYVMVHPYDHAAPVKPEQPISQCPTKVSGITYMQDITDQNEDTILSNMTDNAQYYLRDKRDEKPYCVSKIVNGDNVTALWMTQNLRITGTISATDSNFTGSDFNVSAYDLKTDGASGGGCYYDTDGYNNPCSHTPDADDLTTTGLTAEQIGAWYNYAAATAGEITGSSNSTVATQDICPAGWHLPSYDTNGGAGSINSIISSVSAFSSVTGGSYYGGSVNYTGSGLWWSTAASSSNYRRVLGYNGNNLSTSNANRGDGGYIRCVRASL